MLAIAAILLIVALIEGSAYVAAHPQDVPWTTLDLDQPIGRFTGPKLAALGEDPRRCRALLAEGGVQDRAAATIEASAPCGYADGMRLVRETQYRPAGLVTSCPVAAALAIWERDILQPAALRHFGRRITAIDHAGSYSCRRIGSGPEGRFSEHATADAVDILGFRLADGRRVSVLRDWTGDPSRAAFLREVRDGGCRLFSTALSPGYNAAHADHLHFDQAARGAVGGRLCR
ncbi:MAG: extensin family protein [Sphingomonas bacterium]|nr:extensin family protein [Sphingomonas bacterium]